MYNSYLVSFGQINLTNNLYTLNKLYTQTKEWIFICAVTPPKLFTERSSPSDSRADRYSRDTTTDTIPQKRAFVTNVDFRPDWKLRDYECVRVCLNFVCTCFATFN